MSLLIKNIILNGNRRDIYIEGSKIKKISRHLDIRAKEIIDGRLEKAAFPGLINYHSHAAMVLLRGYADDLPLADWLEKKIWPLEAKLNEDDVYWGTKLACLEMIKTGTICFNDMYWHPEAALAAADEMGIKAIIGLLLIDFDKGGGRDNIEMAYNKLKSKTSDTIGLSLAPHAIYSVSKDNLIWAKDFAGQNKLPLHIHLSETEKELTDCLEKHKMRPVEYLDKIGFLGKNAILAHSIWLSEKEIKILAQRGCSVVYCPCSNMKLASGVFPYRAMARELVNIYLGTDGAASNNNLDLFEEMKFASLLQKLGEMDPIAAPAKEIFKIVTGGRRIREGGSADLILINLGAIALTPGHNLISDMVYSISGDSVSDVICNGKVIMRDREVEREEKIIREAKKRAESLVK